jgi:hypothetical protein
VESGVSETRLDGEVTSGEDAGNIVFRICPVDDIGEPTDTRSTVKLRVLSRSPRDHEAGLRDRLQNEGDCPKQRIDSVLLFNARGQSYGHWCTRREMGHRPQPLAVLRMAG